MKTVYNLIGAFLIGILATLFFFPRNTLREDNIIAYRASMDSIANNNVVLKNTIQELALQRDSIDSILYSTIQELKIKNKKVSNVQYVKSVITKIDTISFRDTIFVENLKIDTTIQDKWYATKLSLKYPDSITLTPSFTSEKVVVFHYTKEYVNTPSKIFFIRWFQKKRKVVSVEIKDRNPYIQEIDNKFIDIVK